MFRRKMGHEREDRAYDKLLRHKSLAIYLFSMLGLVSTVLMDVLPHQYGKDDPGINIYDEASETLKIVLLSLQLVLTVSTLITIGLILQYYHLLVMNKRKEWSGIGISTAVFNETQEEKQRREKEHYDLVHSYSIWASTTFKYAMLAEVLLHMVHPIVFFSDFLTGTIFEACKIVVLTRLYLTLRLVHFYSDAYRSRFEIINQHDEFKLMNLKISKDFTIKSAMYLHTGWVVGIWSILTVIVGGFSMYLIERDADSTESWVVSPADWSGDIGNSLWFAFITATSIGYGDYYPSTLKGRLMACVIGVMGLFVLVVFKALLTNQLKPSKYEKYIKEYLGDVETRESVENAAASLVQRVWRHKKATREFGILPVFHKSNVVFCGIKRFRQVRFKMKHADSFVGAGDVVLDAKMEQLMAQAETVGLALQYQRDRLMMLHKKVYKSLKAIKDRMDEKKRGR